MPTYYYRCDCGFAENRQEVAGWEKPTECPECGKLMMRIPTVTKLPEIRRYTEGDLKALQYGYY